jgi:hypothetical protein
VNSGHSDVPAVVRFDLVVESSQCLHVAAIMVRGVPECKDC